MWTWWTEPVCKDRIRIGAWVDQAINRPGSKWERGWMRQRQDEGQALLWLGVPLEASIR